MSNPMAVKAARVLCKRSAEMCNVDVVDSWALYGHDYIADAQAMLDAVGATDLLDFAIAYIDAWGDDAAGSVHVRRLAEKAIAKAEGRA